VSGLTGLTHPLVAALLVLAGLVAPVPGSVSAHAAPSGPVTAGARGALGAQLRPDPGAYLRESGGEEHISGAGLRV